MKQLNRNSLVYRVVTNPGAMVPIAIWLLLAMLAALGPLLMPFDPIATDLYSIMLPPDSVHILGTDSAGRDILVRLAFATRFSIGNASIAVLIAMAIGVTSGLIAGYFGGWFDQVSTWGSSVIQALPGLVVLLAAGSVLGPSMTISMMIFGVLLSPAYYRLVYTTVRAVRNELYVDAARVSGLSDARIIGRHVLSVVRAPIIIQTAIVASISIAVQSGLEFLGMGDSTTPSWGAMLNDAFSKLFENPSLLIWPGVTISMVTLSLVVFANTLRDELERTQPRKKRSANALAQTLIEEEAGDETIFHPAGVRSADQILQVSKLAIGYPAPDGGFKKVVHSAQLDIRRGEVVGLIGESGSGKTQTAFAIMGLLPANGKVVSGSILFEGEELAGVNVSAFEGLRGRKIAYIPQEPMSNLDPSFTIGFQLMEPIRKVLGLGKNEARARALELLTKVGIPNPEATLAKYPHEISGGQAQRVLIAGAVSCNPDLIIADEPTTALDVTVQAEVLDLLRSLQKESNTSMLLVTHNFGVVADICDYVNVMQLGRIVEAGPVVDIFTKPIHPYTQALLGAILDGGPARAPYAIKPGEDK